MTDRMTFIVDDDVSLVGLLETLHAAGLTISSIDGFRFRLHRMPGKVVDLDARRQRERRLDAQMRAGMRALHGLPPDPPGAA